MGSLEQPLPAVQELLLPLVVNADWAGRALIVLSLNALSEAGQLIISRELVELSLSSGWELCPPNGFERCSGPRMHNPLNGIICYECIYTQSRGRHPMFFSQQK